jgi:hypothetical protein
LGLPGRAESQKQASELCPEEGQGSRKQEIKKGFATMSGLSMVAKADVVY